MKTKFTTFTLSLLLLTSRAFAQEPGVGGDHDMADLAKKLNDPTASLISVPIQTNVDFGGGPSDDGMQIKVNLQPVVPIDLNEQWKILSRYIVPYVWQEDRIGTDSQSGLADSTATFWLSPQAEKKGAPIWGVGPIFQLPTASDDLLGAEKWCVGPSAIVLKQEHGYTYGFLANQVWSFAGDDSRDYVNYLFLQPFFSYTTPRHTTYTINSENVYDWNSEEWTVPVNLMLTQLVKNRRQADQLSGRRTLLPR
ncbi:MAG: hypothetical protein QM760_21510 [Nibricoccus sp.]